MIELRLENFRCYREKTFTFNIVGSTLISGKSGYGKSTILLAMLFALYNKGGKENETYGGEKKTKVKTKVVLIFNDNFKIVRSRNHSHLVFNYVYENDVAQQMIYKIFGKNFDVIGYIPQDTTDSFLNKKAMDKRDFLESTKFENENLPEKKNQIDALVKEYKQKMEKTATKLETTKSFLMEKPTEVKFPLGKKKDIQFSIEQEKKRFESTKNQIANTKSRFAKLQKRLNELRIAKTFLTSKDENINQICSQLESLSLEIGNFNDYIGDEQVALYQEKLQARKHYSQLYHLISQRDADERKLTTMRENEILELTSSIEAIESELWTTYTKEEALELIQTNEDVLKDLSKIKSLREKKKANLYDIPTLEKKKNEVSHQLEIAKNDLQRLAVLICPGCDAEVLLHNGSLIPCEISESSSGNNKNKAALIKLIQTLGNELNQIDVQILQQKEAVEKNNALDLDIESILSQYEEELDEEELRSDFNEVNAYYKSQISLEKKRNDLKHKIEHEEFSASFKASIKEVAKLNGQIQKLRSVMGGDVAEDENDGKEEEQEDEEMLRDIISENQQKKSRLEHLQKQVHSQTQLKNKLLSQVEDYKTQFLEKYTSLDDENVLLTECETLKIQQKEYEAKHEEHRINLQLIDDYLNYKKAIEGYNEHVTKITLLEEELKVDSQYFTQAKILKQDIIEAELIALTNTINELNSMTNVYLQEFFDYPIFVNLSCFKEDRKKNEKPEINIEIKYKDMDCTLSSLSGGEYARVNLAFTLSLAQMFKTPMLLLDETMSALDEETADMVFKSIRRHFKHIPVISILHQVTSEGYFDQVIKL